MNLKNKVIVITGGNSGLGKATAKILSAVNKVVILGKNEKEIPKVAKELKCDGIICDITNHLQVKKTFTQIIKKYKKIDCLINCAGVYTKGPIEKNSAEVIQNVMSVNATGTMLCVNGVVSQMKKQKFGRIINIVSTGGLDVKKESSVYYASKWAVTGFTKSLQLELSRYNISVVGFYPGFFKTDIGEKGGKKVLSFENAMPVQKVAKAIEYLVNIDSDIVIKGLEIASIKSI